MLTDTGPLVALLDADDNHHAVCLSASRALPAAPLLTTWPCFTEAMYLLGEAGGYFYQERLWEMLSRGRLHLLELTTDETEAMAVLMARYRDVPMDLADASLAASAQSRGLRQLFTLDADFYIFRLADGSVLDLIR